MKRKGLISLFSTTVFLGTATLAMAGAYGEPEQPAELPPPPPVVHEAPAPQPPPPMMRPDLAAVGPYLGVGALYGFENFDGSGSDVGNSWGFNARAGYRLHPNFAVEALYEDFVQFDADPAGHLDAYDIMLQGKGYLATGCVQPYGSLGVGVMNVQVHSVPAFVVPKLHSDETNFAMRFGAGADIYITPNLYAEIEAAYLLPTNSVDGADTVVASLGLGYKFN